MDKLILHSVLETVTAGQTININFNEPFAELTGDYLVLQSKTGRGRGGSRILEVRSVADSSRVISTLQIDGKDKALGTGTSEYIVTLTVDGKVHGLEAPADATRAVKTRTMATKRETNAARVSSTNATVCEKVANALGNVLADNPNTIFRLTGRVANSPMTGEWRVTSHTFENKVLRMECVDSSNSERTLSFDSSVDGPNLKDAEVVFVS